MKRALSFSWAMTLLVVLAGCSTTPTANEPTHHVAAHGTSLRHAQLNAQQQAEAQCQEAQPLVIGQEIQPAPPAFTGDPTPSSPPPSEIGNLAAATHEGESPVVRLGFRCTLP